MGERYTLGREVGRGGMAHVFLAHDRKHDRPVAVKVLRGELAATVAPDRFRREIEMAARLQHPHIVPIYDSGGADALLFFVMPYIEGETLRDRLTRDTRLPAGVTIRLGLEVAEALSYAHSRNVVHRDIKPENILLFRGHAMVADFGIATAVTRTEDISLTSTGGGLGTPAYMSPEQAFGEKTVDGRADIYSLGCVLYEMLAGTPPHTGKTLMAVIAAKSTQPVKDLHTLAEDVPPHVADAIHRALEREPADRFAQIAEFADALSSAQPVLPARPHGRAQAAQGVSIAVLPFANRSGAADDEFLSDGISEDLIYALSRLPGLRVVARTSAFAFKGRAVDLRAIGAELGVGAVLDGSVRRQGARLRITADLIDVATGFALWSERYDREQGDVFAVQDEITRAIVDTLKVRLLGDAPRLVDTPTTDFAAYESYLKGRFEWNQRTEASMRRGIEQMQRAIATDPRFVLAHSGLADTYITLAVYGAGRADTLLVQARESAERALLMAPTLAEALTARASVRALLDHDWDGAERDYVQALTIREQYATAHQWYAMHLLAPRGRFTEARARIARARELDPLSAPIATSAAILRLYERDHPQAVAEFRLVIAQHPAFPLAHYALGGSLSALGEHAEAVDVLRRAALLSGESPEVLSALACALAAAGDPGEARALLARLERTALERYVSPVLLAQVYAVVGEPMRALDELDRAAAMKSVEMPYLHLRAPLDALHDEPRFRALVASVLG